MSESIISAIVAVVVPLLLEVARRYMGDRFSHRMVLIARAIDIAFHATTNLARYTTTKVDDKAAHALGLVKAQLAAQGIKWGPAIETQARQTFDAMHAKEKAGALFPSTPPA